MYLVQGIGSEACEFMRRSEMKQNGSHLRDASFVLQGQRQTESAMSTVVSWSPPMSSPEALPCQATPGMNQGDLLFRNGVPGDPHRLSPSVYPSELTGTLGNLCIDTSLPATHDGAEFWHPFLG